MSTEKGKPRAAGPEWGPRENLKLLNHALRRVDGPEKVTGRARYTHDVRLPGMVYARLLLCPHPTAECELDCSPALKLRGVVAARGLGGKNTVTTRFLGEPIAAVAAETPELAEDGVRAILAKYKPLPHALDVEQALAPDAGKVRRNGNVSDPDTKGDEAKFQQAFDACDARVEGTYRLPVQHHASLETHGVVVDFKGGDEATVYASTQGTFTIPGDAAKALKLSGGKVTSVVEYMGGGFGSKFGLGVEGLAACELALELKRPVHLMMTREDEFLAAGNRSGTVAKVRAGATKDGKLRALWGEITRLGGIGPGSFRANSFPYVYKLADEAGLRSSIRSVFTHFDSSRAMRAPGHPQASFPIESVLDELAYKLGLDLLTIRKQNLTDPVYARQLDRVAERIGWAKHPHKNAPQKQPDADGTMTGIGFAISTWGGGGGDECKVRVTIASDGAVQSIVGSQDLGTGVRTYVAAIVAEELGLPLEGVTAKIGNSNYGRANASGGSATTGSLAPSVKVAAYNAAQKLLEHLSKTLKRPAEELALRGAAVVDLRASDDKGQPKQLMSWKEACATLGAAGLTADGDWLESLASRNVHGAQAARVKVDLATGHVQVLDMVGVQDCGLPLNRTAVESQLNGGMVQALSYALLEERVIDPALGIMLNANFVDYKLAGCEEMPEMVPLIDEDDIGRGVIGMAEPAIIPGHSAIGNAIYNACGVRLRSLPFTADKVLDGLAALAENGGAK